MAKMSFNQFKVNLVEADSQEDGDVISYVPTSEGDADDYRIRFRGQDSSFAYLMYRKSTNRFYIPDDDGAILATNDYSNFDADQIFDFGLFKITLEEVQLST